MISVINEIVHPVSASCSAALPLFHLFLVTTAAPPFHSAAMPLSSIRHRVFCRPAAAPLFQPFAAPVPLFHSQHPFTAAAPLFQRGMTLFHTSAVSGSVCVSSARRCDGDSYPRAAGGDAKDVDATAGDRAFRDALGKPMPCG